MYVLLHNAAGHRSHGSVALRAEQEKLQTELALRVREAEEARCAAATGTHIPTCRGRGRNVTCHSSPLISTAGAQERQDLAGKLSTETERRQRAARSAQGASTLPYVQRLLLTPGHAELSRVLVQTKLELQGENVGG